MIWDEIPEPIYQKYDYAAYSCETCMALSLLGGFENEHSESDPEEKVPPLPRLFPKAANISPPTHTVSPNNPIPSEVLGAYVEAWPLRYLAPRAFANQTRRALEFICEHQHARGKDLFEQLKDLSDRGIFPSGLIDIATLIRELGNIGSHATKKEISRWDAELLDSLFQMVIEYVYLSPARLRRLRERMSI